ncbi:MAG: NTP transferase domain-containing protein [Candidatus Aminicenantes bacterium]|nr:NTP transferase domain-containing protein [Candidatus Aminicenantes bacterium]
MKCVIIAAGKGSRLAHLNTSKPLISVGGIALIERAIRTAHATGCEDFLVVVGYQAEKVNQFLQQVEKRQKCSISTVYNPLWQRENGMSVLSAREAVKGKFFLLMSDHIFDHRILLDLNQFSLEGDELVLAVDTRVKNHPNVDYEDVTKVCIQSGFIIDIGKTISEYNAFDTGIFLVTPSLFRALEQSMKTGDYRLSGGIKVMSQNKKAKVMEIGEKVWIDVDDDRALQRAEEMVSRLPAL